MLNDLGRRNGQNVLKPRELTRTEIQGQKATREHGQITWNFQATETEVHASPSIASVIFPFHMLLWSAGKYERPLPIQRFKG